MSVFRYTVRGPPPNEQHDESERAADVDAMANARDRWIAETYAREEKEYKSKGKVAEEAEKSEGKVAEEPKEKPELKPNKNKKSKKLCEKNTLLAIKLSDK